MMWKWLLRYTFIAYFIFLHVFIIFVLLKSNIIEKYSVKLGLVELTPHYYYNAKLAKHLRNEYKLSDSIILFLGDSIVDVLPTENIADNIVNYGISRDDTVGLLKRLPLYDETVQKAEAIFLAIGVNDLHNQHSLGEFFANYQNIVAQFPADIPIVFSALLPITLERDQQWQIQDDIALFNAKLAEFATQQPHYHFFNGAAAMQDAGGYLQSHLHRGDGLHLNAAGYAVWSAEITRFLRDIKVL